MRKRGRSCDWAGCHLHPNIGVIPFGYHCNDGYDLSTFGTITSGHRNSVTRWCRFCELLSSSSERYDDETENMYLSRVYLSHMLIQAMLYTIIFFVTFVFVWIAGLITTSHIFLLSNVLALPLWRSIEYLCLDKTKNICRPK